MPIRTIDIVVSAAESLDIEDFSVLYSYDPLSVEFKVTEDWIVILDFAFDGHPYTYVFSKNPSKLLRLFEIFHAAKNRDPNIYGQMGQLNALNCEQKLRILGQFFRDVFCFVRQILKERPAGVLDYAVGHLFRMKPSKEDEQWYSNYVMRVACKMIVNLQFTVTSEWTPLKVLFSP